MIVIWRSKHNHRIVFVSVQYQYNIILLILQKILYIVIYTIVYIISIL